MAGRSIDPTRPPTDDDSAKPPRDAFGDPVIPQRRRMRLGLRELGEAWRTSDPSDKQATVIFTLIPIVFIVIGVLMPRADMPLWFLIPWCAFCIYGIGVTWWKLFAGDDDPDT